MLFPFWVLGVSLGWRPAPDATTESAARAGHTVVPQAG